MPQLRQDLVTGRWVAIATERAKRPSSFSRAAAVAVPPAATCPFCVGHESMTPPEVMAYRAAGSEPNTPGWEVRVVPNLYPAFGPADIEPITSSCGPYTTMTGVGVHEVIVSSTSHVDDFASLPVNQIDQIVRAFVERYDANARNPVIQYLLIINNHGKEAGASLEHPHSQLFGIPLVPFAVREELDGVRRYRSEHGACVYCEILATEQKAGERIIWENDSFLVYAPFASRTPFEASVLPKWHSARVQTMTTAQQHDFASALHELTARISHGLNDPPYNFYIHTAPVHQDGEPGYHWHLELLPKLAIAAGFELGTGIMINVATPEAAAEYLRGVDVSTSAVSAATPGIQHR
ncbi:MAG TPA: galactose-1-phosphate uridylyltransferase [Chloroflexota bacterium]|nr:galactose-1-phosphate uridylyltransferase [Chloroflexota bacterium]